MTICNHVLKLNTFEMPINLGSFICTGQSAEIRNAALIEKGGLISSNVFTMIKNITGISKEAKIASGETAFCSISPYLRFKDVQIAGD